MSRKLFVKFIGQSFWTISCAVLLGAMLTAMTGCNSRARAKNERENKADAPVKASKIAPELVGKWQKKQPGGKYAEYAVYAENLGVFESYEISSDARIRRTNLIAAKNYDCRVEDTAVSEGAITPVSDSELNITLDVGTLRHTNACSPQQNYAAPTKATNTDFQWKLAKSENGATELCLTQANGETACYRRVE